MITMMEMFRWMALANREPSAKKRTAMHAELRKVEEGWRVMELVRTGRDPLLDLTFTSPDDAPAGPEVSS